MKVQGSRASSISGQWSSLLTKSPNLCGNQKLWKNLVKYACTGTIAHRCACVSMHIYLLLLIFFPDDVAASTCGKEIDENCYLQELNFTENCKSSLAEKFWNVVIPSGSGEVQR